MPRVAGLREDPVFGGSAEQLQLYAVDGATPIPVFRTPKRTMVRIFPSGLFKRSKPSLIELARFTSQLATMLEVGLTPLVAMQVLINQRSSTALTKALHRITEAVSNGDPLSAGMSSSRMVFSALYVNLVRVGEVSGTLPTTLCRLALYLENAARMRREVAIATIYPCSIILTAAAVSTFLLVFIIPSFKGIFADFGGELPWLTRMVISISEHVVASLPTLSLLLASLFFIGYRTFKTIPGREIADALLLKLPLLGDLTKHSALARTTRTLGTTLGSGVPILLALQVSSEAAGNAVVRRELEAVRDYLAEGNSLGSALERAPIFPSSMVEMLRVGETTGHLDTILEKVASSFEEGMTHQIALLKQLFEPVMIVVVGGIVGVVVLAMYLPIFSLGGLLG